MSQETGVTLRAVPWMETFEAIKVASDTHWAKVERMGTGYLIFADNGSYVLDTFGKLYVRSGAALKIGDVLRRRYSFPELEICYAVHLKVLAKVPFAEVSMRASKAYEETIGRRLQSRFWYEAHAD
jgi:hypothetical protein